MPKPSDVMLTVPVYQQRQYDVSRFLKTKPLALGILVILLALLGLSLTIWNGCFVLLWSPISFILTGVTTVSAASTCKPCLVKSSQILSYLNVPVAALSLPFHFFYTRGVTCFLLMACDILIFIFCVTIALTSCYCCCRPQTRQVQVSYMNGDLPVNHIVLMGQPDSSAVVQTISSVMYVLPSAHGSVPPVPLSNYSPVPTVSPPAYDEVSYAPPSNYGPVPNEPPPAYEYEDLQTRR
ncbi:hypothetical protein Q8A67_013360 [Cirrhinus molitorella]|uniref:Uncharacterized protein n=1 Tax=Cirrhinus molitorella TaxID=172907 RepID=A0AA88PPE5_9TELE|nr:hypothetical protein Q8A67_013360 [Cirrhinus molitorella]